MKEKRGRFSGQLGFIMAAAGSAVRNQLKRTIT